MAVSVRRTRGLGRFRMISEADPITSSFIYYKGIEGAEFQGFLEIVAD
jgi:hypothetical protein